MIRATIGLASLPVALMIPVVEFLSPPAHADTLSPSQSAYVRAYGGDVCSALDRYHTINGVVAVVKGVVNSGFSASESVDIVNAAVATYCDRNWALLQQTGAYFRDQKKGGQLV